MEMGKKMILLKNPATERSRNFEPTPNRGQKFRVSDFFVEPFTHQIKSPEVKKGQKMGLDM